MRIVTAISTVTVISFIFSIWTSFEFNNSTNHMVKLNYEFLMTKNSVRYYTNKNNKKPYSTEYYPWNDSTDYDAVCRGIQKKIKSFKGPPIVHVGTGGGLGHKFISLLHSFTAALVMKRPLSCMIVLSCNN